MSHVQRRQTLHDLASFPGSSGDTAQTAEAQEAGRRHRQSVCRGGKKEVVMAADRRRMVHSARKLGKTAAIQHLEPVLGSVALQNSKMEKALECRQKGEGRMAPAVRPQEVKAKDGMGAGVSN